STTGYVRIAEPLQNVVVQEGQRAKFVCKIDVHDLDLQRLKVLWKINGRFFRAEPSRNRRLIFKQDRGWHTLIVRKTRVHDAGIYSCIASVGLDTDKSSAHLKIESAPDPPNNVKLVSCHGNSAALSWNPGEENGNKVIEFQVQFNTSDNPDVWHDFEERFDQKSRMVTLELYPGLTYSFRVKARNVLGSSKPSIPADRKCTTPPDRPDRNPRNVRTNTGVKGTLVIEWTPMSRLHFHGPRFRYHVHWRPHGSYKWSHRYVDDPAQGFLDVDTGDVYQVYDLQVKAENSMGEAHHPAYIYLGHSGESEPLVAPGNFSLNPEKSLEPHTAHFIWDPVDLDPKLICGKFKGYKVNTLITVMSVYPLLGLLPADNSSPIKVALSDLPAYVSLQAQVAVLNSHYTGPYSKLLEFFTPEGLPSPVQDLRRQAYGVAYVLLKWRPPEQPNGVIQGYDIAYQQVFGLSLGQIRPLMPHINDPSTLGARITGLRPEHRYRFIVWARTRKGRGEANFVDIVTAKGTRKCTIRASSNIKVDPENIRMSHYKVTPKGTPPHTPRIQVAELGNSSLNVTWMADQASRDVKYQVEYRESGQPMWHNTEYVFDKSWLTLNKNQVPVKDLEVRLVASNRLGEYVFDKSWLTLNKNQVPVKDLEVRLVASNRLGDTATSRTIALAKSPQNTGYVKSHIPDNHGYQSAGSSQNDAAAQNKGRSFKSTSWTNQAGTMIGALLVLSCYSLVFQQ
ncbi:hypothetical protein EGW08_003595, partial [Elysia chlorotica]